jgi:hypothetical protein
VQVTQAVGSAQHDLEGCFDEWAARPLTAESVGQNAPDPRLEDSDIVVTLTVAPDGTTDVVTAKGDDAARSPSLKLCVESAVGRVHYPSGPEALDVEVAVTWAAPNMVNTSARIVGHRASAQGRPG